MQPLERLNIMKTSFARIAITPSDEATQLALQEPEELTCWKNSLTLETVAMIGEYQDILSKIVRWHKDNDGVHGTEIPSIDASLRHALQVAMKVTRAASKADHGQWAIRKLKSERLSNRCTDME